MTFAPTGKQEVLSKMKITGCATLCFKRFSRYAENGMVYSCRTRQNESARQLLLQLTGFLGGPVKPCVSSTHENQYKPLEDDRGRAVVPTCLRFFYDNRDNGDNTFRQKRYIVNYKLSLLSLLS